MIEVHITRMNGTRWLWATIDWTHQWRWITERVGEELGCDYAAIDILETDDGDVLTVGGERVGRLT